MRAYCFGNEKSNLISKSTCSHFQSNETVDISFLRRLFLGAQIGIYVLTLKKNFFYQCFSFYYCIKLHYFYTMSVETNIYHFICMTFINEKDYGNFIIYFRDYYLRWRFCILSLLFSQPSGKLSTKFDWCLMQRYIKWMMGKSVRR